jgi:hypothetical protein
MRENSQCEGGDLNPYANYGASTSNGQGGSEGPETSGESDEGPPRSLPVDPPKPAMANRVANEADVVEAALSAALTAAATAGRFDVVAQLAKELEARRLARAATNVIAIDRSTRGGRS